MDSSTIVDFLQNPSAYDDAGAIDVELIETHISWVFLAGDHAYKLKKPVRFDFLDFSTQELRRQACETELRLNRRLAADVYLEVLPVSQSANQSADGQLNLHGDGETVDWVVKMRRLDAEHALDFLIRNQRVSDAAIKQVAELLLQFYANAQPVPLSSEEYLQEIAQHVQGNLTAFNSNDDKLSRCQSQIRRIHAAQLRYLITRQRVFANRVKEQRIIDGHGDLRPEHVYLESQPVIIDCIEFNDEFRHLDELDEICFLAMECTLLGAGWIGEQILASYAAASGDAPPQSLLAFYSSYRACVRAKVNLIRLTQVEAQAAEELTELTDLTEKYLQLADTAAGELGPPLLIVVRGPAGVGKTTVAAELAGMLAADHLQTDQVRRELFGEPSADNRYDEANRLKVYAEIFARARASLEKGLNVVLDGTFLTHDLQLECEKLAGETHTQLLLVNCHLPAEEAAARIRHRAEKGDSFSEATVETNLQQSAQEHAPPPHLPQCDVDTSQEMKELLKVVLSRCARLEE